MLWLDLTRSAEALARFEWPATTAMAIATGAHPARSRAPIKPLREPDQFGGVSRHELLTMLLDRAEALG